MIPSGAAYLGDIPEIIENFCFDKNFDSLLGFARPKSQRQAFKYVPCGDSIRS